MNFFPTPYPGEILYSVLARYSIRSGNIKEIHNFDDLFGTRNCVSTVELPTQLDALIGNMPVNAKYTAEEFIFENTLFPVYGAFLDPDRARDIIKLMKNDGGSTVYIKIGLITSGVELNRYFRFCPQCFVEDIKLYGEPYWHRSHQVTGVFVCTKHRMPLYNSTELIRGGNRQRFVSASRENCIVKQEITYSRELTEKMYCMAHDIETLLNKRFDFKKPVWFKNQFRTRLVEKEYMRMNNFIYLKKLKLDFLDFYGEEYLELVQSPVSIKGSCWLSDMVRNNNKTTYALRYLLLARFLDIPVEDLFNKPLGFNGDIGEMSNTIVYQQLWDQRLVELIESGFAINEIERILKTSAKTIKRSIKRLGIEPPWEFNGGKTYTPRNYIGSEEFNKKKMKLREEWLVLHAKYPNKSSNQIRKENSGIGDWLSKHDKEWFKQHYRRIDRRANYVDWEKRDIELLPQVKRVVEEMWKGKPERITWASIASKLGISGWLSRRKDKLPLTKGFVDSVIESLEEFQIRKIRWAIDKLEKEGKEVRLWTIVETAGVKTKYMKGIAKEMKEILAEKGYDCEFLQ